MFKVPHSRRMASAILCSSVLLVATACGGAGSGGSSASQPYRVALVPPDTAYAKRVLVQIADLGVDWYPKTESASASSDPDPSCLKTANPPATKTGDSGTTARYVQGSGLQLNSATDVYKTPDQAHQVMAA